jgi:hypothetical protein
MTIPFDPCFMDQEVLQGATQRRNIRRQAADQSVIGAGMGQGAMVGVVVGRRKSNHGHTSAKAAKSYQPVTAAQQQGSEVTVVLTECILYFLNREQLSVGGSALAQPFELHSGCSSMLESKALGIWRIAAPRSAPHVLENIPVL